jgi:hypothetical protein
MLKINILTRRIDAAKQYRRMREGDTNVDYLGMLEDRTVRRRIHQNIRNDKKRPALFAAQHARREEKIKFQQDRRAGMAWIPLLNRVVGQPNLCVGKQGEAGKDRLQRYSRCLHCGTDFPIERNFEFCDESLTQAGACKKAWNAAHHVEIKPRPAKFNMVTPEDVDHAKRTRPMMPRPANVGNGRGSRPLPSNTEWVWDNEVGYRAVNKQK